MATLRVYPTRWLPPNHAGVRYTCLMDTLIFGLFAVVAFLIIRGGSRLVVIGGWALATVAAFLLFLHHVTSVLPLNF